ncbi:unnamed protein product [Angiostrongylus costaricensis]|uniref:BZIP domain-containing protein n=1 Tax=Angiostrongylus costaricensis TaxID=334426 RepID=A0A0R3PLJ9_ANGCS|nr:unnamed protein product [Angiostrongylus costaricensis]
MDLHGTLSALMRPLAAIPPSTFPLTSFLQHPLMSSLAFPLNAANHLDPTLFDITVTAESQSTVTPKKTRLDSPTSRRRFIIALELDKLKTLRSVSTARFQNGEVLNPRHCCVFGDQLLRCPAAIWKAKGLYLTPENGIKSGKFQDEAYYERRRRNNDAAKRSRDARRIKEEAIAARAAQLERENGQLRAQVAILKSETARLQLMLFSQRQSLASDTKKETKAESMIVDTLLENTATSTTVLQSDIEIKP